MKSNMSSKCMFLESLIRQSTLNPKGTIMGKTVEKTKDISGYELPWDTEIQENICENTQPQEVVNEQAEIIPNQVSLAFKLRQTSRKLANLRSEIS